MIPLAVSERSCTVGPVGPTLRRARDRESRARGSGVALLVAMAVVPLLSSCGPRNHSQAVSIHSLEVADTVMPSATRRAIMCETGELDRLYHPLGRRLGLFQVRSPQEWELLRRHAPELGPAPDLDRGIVIGLASHAGLPVNGTWPIRLEAVRVYNGAGFAIGHFQGGSFLPDGTTYVETAQYDGLATVLMVEVNGTRFFPE